jgi:DNA-binding Xre family transcriptional regulator
MNKYQGTTFESFLEEENLLDHAEAVAIKRVLAYQIEQTMMEKELTKTAVASKLKTSRAAVDRLLDPENTSVTLTTLTKISHLLWKRLQLSFE